jgi:hypothetical protein
VSSRDSEGDRQPLRNLEIKEPMVDTVVGSMLGNSVDIMEKLKSRRAPSVIITAGPEKSHMVIMRISVPHFDFIKSISVAFRWSSKLQMFRTENIQLNLHEFQWQVIGRQSINDHPAVRLSLDRVQYEKMRGFRVA